MTKYTDTVSKECEIKTVFAIDVLDKRHMLLIEHIATSDTLGNCGLGPRKCAILQDWVNMQRAAAGKPPLTDEQKITPATTIQQVIDYVC